MKKKPGHERKDKLSILSILSTVRILVPWPQKNKIGVALGNSKSTQISDPSLNQQHSEWWVINSLEREWKVQTDSWKYLCKGLSCDCQVWGVVGTKMGEISGEVGWWCVSLVKNLGYILEVKHPRREVAGHTFFQPHD